MPNPNPWPNSQTLKPPFEKDLCIRQNSCTQTRRPDCSPKPFPVSLPIGKDLVEARGARRQTRSWLEQSHQAHMFRRDPTVPSFRNFHLPNGTCQLKFFLSAVPKQPQEELLSSCRTNKLVLPNGKTHKKKFLEIANITYQELPKSCPRPELQFPALSKAPAPQNPQGECRKPDTSSALPKLGKITKSLDNKQQININSNAKTGLAER